MQARLRTEDESAPDFEHKKLRQQLGLAALAKRCLILHSSKFVALLIFAAAMQSQTAIGLLLLGESALHAPARIFKPYLHLFTSQLSETTIFSSAHEVACSTLSTS